MSESEYHITISRDSTIPEGRERTLQRMRTILRCFPSGVSDRANCYLYGLIKGWVLGDVIGVADADALDELLPPRPDDGVIAAIPFGRDPNAPEVEALSEDYVIEQKRSGWWFSVWMGIKNDLYFFHCYGHKMPERSVLAWLGYLRGALEGTHISQAEYDRLRAMLPSINDDLTPLVAATE